MSGPRSARQAREPDEEDGGLADAELSRLLFEAREMIDMWGDVVAIRAGRRSEQVDRVRDGLDAYRAERGWSPHGFGGEST